MRDTILPQLNHQQHHYQLQDPPTPSSSTGLTTSASNADLDGHGDHSTPLADEEDYEEIMYVNAKQYHRILKRRAARARLEELHRQSSDRKPYLHESRHRHALRRPRGPGGRFLTAAEQEALRDQHGDEPQSASQRQSDPSDMTEPFISALNVNSTLPNRSPAQSFSGPSSSSVHVNGDGAAVDSMLQYQGATNPAFGGANALYTDSLRSMLPSANERYPGRGEQG